MYVEQAISWHVQLVFPLAFLYGSSNASPRRFISAKYRLRRALQKF